MIYGGNDYKTVFDSIKWDKRRSFVYDKNGYSSLIYYFDVNDENSNVRYLAYLDTTRQSAERSTYIKKMNTGKKNYTEEGLLESEKEFGLFLLETNNKEKSEVFCDFKRR